MCPGTGVLRLIGRCGDLLAPPQQVLDSLKFWKRFLNSLKPDIIGNRSDWLRFVMVRAEAGNLRAMMPRMARGAVLLLDRHYNSLE